MFSSSPPALLRAILLLSLGLGTIPTPGRASSVFSGPNTFYVSPAGSDTNDGSPAAPKQHVQAALDVASDGDTVVVGDGTYAGDGNRDLNFGGKNLTLTSQNGAASTIIDAGGTHDTPHRGILFQGIKTAAVVSGLTFQGGNETNYPNYSGAGLQIIGGSAVTVRDCRFSGNTAGRGGGIDVSDDQGAGAVTLTRCAFSANHADYGGGYASQYAAGAVTLSDCTFEGNMASSGGGANPGGVDLFQHCAFTQNTATSEGGGMYVEGNPTVIGCTFDRNVVPAPNGGDGGGVYNVAGPTTFTRCRFTGNVCGNGSGAGFFNGYYNAATLDGCVFDGNRAEFTNSTYPSGGGYYASEDSTNVLTNCVFRNNFAALRGGGLFNAGGFATTVRNLTFTGNSAQFGGGYYDNEQYGADNTRWTLVNCLLYGDSDATGPNEITVSPDAYNAPTVAANFSDVQGGFPGTANLNADPLFVDAPNGDLHLQPGSPCLGAGTTENAPAFDAGGFTRPSPPSIGAYEASPGPTATRVTSSRNPSVAGQLVTFTAAVAGVDTAAPGAVQFFLDGTAVGGPVTLDATGRATWTTSALTVGTHTVTAVRGSGTGGSQGSLTQVVLVHLNPVYVSPAGDDAAPGSYDRPKQHVMAAIGATLNGDTIILKDGTYTGAGNRDVSFGGLSLTIRSQNGPAATTIDCGGTETESHRAFTVGAGETAVLKGLTLTHGFASYDYDNGQGGAILVASGGTASLQNCVVTASRGYNQGGGIDNAGTVFLTDTTLSANVSAYGAGVYSSGTFTATRCAFTGNKASSNGGGFLNERTGSTTATVTLTGCTLSGNSSGNNGGGLNNGDTATLTNCLLFGNSAIESGGIQSNGYYGSLTMTGCTMTGNAAGYSWPGLGAGGLVTLTDDVFYGDSGGTDEVHNFGGGNGRFTLSHCDVQTAGFDPRFVQDDGYPGTYTLTADFSADPLFVDAPNGDLHLQAGSPCLGAGVTAPGLSADKDGISRPDPPTVGAYEAPALSATRTALASSLNPSPAGRSVTFTATVSNLAGAAGGTPSGTVTFSDGSGTLGTAALNAAGQASYTLSSLAVGTHLINASYGGTARFVGSSDSLTQTVTAPPVPTNILSVTDLKATRSGGVVTVTGVLHNSGSATAKAAKLTSAKLGTAAASSPLFGPSDLPSGGAQPFSLRFTTAATGRQALRLAGSSVIAGTTTTKPFSTGVYVLVP